jgi:hypothetical protein
LPGPGKLKQHGLLKLWQSMRHSFITLCCLDLHEHHHHNHPQRRHHCIRQQLKTNRKGIVLKKALTT